MKPAKILLAVIALTFTGCGTDLLHGVSHDDIVKVHQFDVQTFSNKVANALHKAQLNVLGSTPSPDDVKPLGPDEDPNKCACRGTGVIRHGDGHTTKCPYHGKGDAGYGSGSKSRHPSTSELDIDGKILFYKGK